MADAKIALSGRLFSDVFPFHIAFDERGTVIQAGAVLSRISPSLVPGSLLSQSFKIERPARAADAASIRQQARSVFLLQSLHRPLKLKGQVIEQDGVFLFLGSPGSRTSRPWRVSASASETSRSTIRSSTASS